MRDSNARMSVLPVVTCLGSPSKSRGGERRHLYPLPDQRVLERLSAIQNRWRRQHKTRTVDAVESDLFMADPIRIRRPANVVGDGTSRSVNGVSAEVRYVPFERRAHFRVGARPRIIRGERRAIDSHQMPRHVSANVIEELTYDMPA